jgi:16S rRNA G966 N2-methylase RsmD
VQTAQLAFDWETLVNEGIEARKQADSAAWELGDLAAKVETTRGRHGKGLQDYADAIGVSYQTLRQYERVSEKFDRRLPHLSWSHHQTVAALDDRFEWLERADVEGWSVGRLREEVWVAQNVTLLKSRFQDANIEAGSIDAIITDPPYAAEYAPAYSDLTAFASRVLKTGGSLVVMTGQTYLGDFLSRLLGDGLKYQWMLAYMTPGSAPHLYHRQVNCNWKPLIWLTKGDYKGETISDVVRSEAPDKRFHEWGQSVSGAIALVERFSTEGDLILDPFLGGGATGAAAVALNRRFIGIDQDEAAIEICQKRFRELRGIE